MSDIVKEVLTVFKADTSGYTPAVAGATKATSALGVAQEETAASAESASLSMETLGGGMKSVERLLGNMVPGLREVSKGFQLAGKASKIFGITTKQALIATGVGAFIVLVGTLISAFQDLSGKSRTELGFLQTKFVEAGEALNKWLGPDTIAAIQISFRALMAGLTLGLSELYLWYKRNSDAHEESNKLAKEGIEISRIAQGVQIELMKQQGASIAEIAEAEIALKKATLDTNSTLTDRIRISAEIGAIRRKAEGDQAALTKKNADAAYAEWVKEGERNLAAAELEKLISDQAADKLIMDEAKNLEDFNAALDRIQKREDAILTSEGRIHNMIMSAGDEELAQDQKISDQNFENNKKKEATAKTNAEAAQALAAIEQESIMQTAQLGINAAKSLMGETLATAVAQAALAIIKVWAGSGTFLMKLFQSAIVASATKKQIDTIRSASAQKFEDGGTIPDNGGMITGRRHYQGGVKFKIGGYAAEAEGGEYIVNRRATARFLPALEKINATGLRKFADGGLTDMRTASGMAGLSGIIKDNAMGAQPVLVIEDFRRAVARLAVVESLASSSRQ